jgi:hypothetical protein
MPLDADFKQHLHSLMVEMYEKTIDEAEKHKRKLVYNAQQTHNAAAPPIAYKDARLYAMELRVGKTIDKYIEAVAIWGYSIDAVFEKEMIQEFWSLTAGPNQFQLPPAIKGQQVQAVQAEYAREHSRLASRLVREGTNRLKELKMKKKQQQPTHVPQSTTNNISFNAPVNNALINSPHSSVVQTNNIKINTQMLDDIDHLSEGNAELHSAALELRHVHAEGGNVADKLLKWVTLATAVGGLTERISQHYPQIAMLIDSLKHIGR